MELNYLGFLGSYEMLRLLKLHSSLKCHLLWTSLVVQQVKTYLPAQVEDMGSVPGPGRSHMPWSSKARVPRLLTRTP